MSLADLVATSSRVAQSSGRLEKIAQLCADLQIDGHRGELTIMRAARALAAFAGRRAVTDEHVKKVSAMSLRHRLRRDALIHGSSWRGFPKIKKPWLTRASLRPPNGSAPPKVWISEYFHVREWSYLSLSNRMPSGPI